MIPLLLFPIDITSFLRALFSNFRPDSPGTNIHVYSSRVGRGSGRGRARSCDHVSSRRNVQNPRDGGHADIPENAHPRGTANPTKCAQGETLRNCRVYRSWTSTRAIPPSLLPFSRRSVYKWNRDTDARSLVGLFVEMRLIFKPISSSMKYIELQDSIQFPFWI